MCQVRNDVYLLIYVIIYFIRSVNNKLLLWAFNQACLEQPTKKAIFYSILTQISKLPRRKTIEREVEKLNSDGKLTRKLNG
jgi:hypothetical protein